MTKFANTDAMALNNDAVLKRFVDVRQRSEWQCKPLEVEDYGLQAMPETSPAKWHLAHTSWFFEIFLLKPYLKNYKVLNQQYEQLFNSYYNGIGPQHPRAQRGLLSRPTVAEVYLYRRHVNEAMLDLLSDHKLCTEDVIDKVILGCHHEQQHQELFFTDLKYSWFKNPLYPVYASSNKQNAQVVEIDNNQSDLWMEIGADVYDIGFDENKAQSKLDGFSFDNELPQHQQYIHDVSISNYLVTNKEYLMFMEDGGYERSELWLSDAWAELQNSNKKHAPLYWLDQGNQWFEYTLQGLLPLNLEQPVCHISAYEADAFARWKECRLPTEFEWEVFAHLTKKTTQKNFLETKQFHPYVEFSGLPVVRGNVWQWTSSAYSPYPGFKTAAGAIGEYNGKFMCNQLVLKGGSCVTSKNHYRDTYRNFFYPSDQWQFSGLRLAK